MRAMPRGSSASVFARQAADRPEAPGLRRLDQFVDRADAELGVDLADGLRPDAGDPHARPTRPGGISVAIWS